jgi:aminoglycoside/choline kinase family phosphotransferase
LEIIALAGDASTRRYFRVALGERFWVLMVWEPFHDPASYPFLNVLNHFSANGVRVPKVEAFSPELGVVLLEDLGDLTLERKFWENQNQDFVLPLYYQANDELIKIHYLASKERGEPSVCQTTQFDTAKFLWEMNYAKEHLLEKLCGLNLQSVMTELEKVFIDICQRLHQEPKYVAHRDYHSRNLMLKLGKVHVIDFQDARKGPIQYDLVSLVHDSYVKLSELSQGQIIEDYLQKAKPYLPTDWSRGHFDEIFLLQTIQRCFKACGSFASFYNTRKDTRYLKYIHSTLSLVENRLRFFPKYAMFRNLLNSEGLLQKKFEIA